MLTQVQKKKTHQTFLRANRSVDSHFVNKRVAQVLLIIPNSLTIPGTLSCQTFGEKCSLSNHIETRENLENSPPKSIGKFGSFQNSSFTGIYASQDLWIEPNPNPIPLGLPGGPGIQSIANGLENSPNIAT